VIDDQPRGVADVRERVRARYAGAATTVLPGGTPSSGDPCTGQDENGTGAGQYTGTEQAEVPGQAVTASLGCGNPVAVADLRDGETVLDLGSGGGLDMLLSAARRVGPTGKAYGLDMTDEVLAVAHANASGRNRQCRVAPGTLSSDRHAASGLVAGFLLGDVHQGLEQPVFSVVP
jgi:2-polyprenyl-3-methyl-5-hydroxy-6-metoxy-1,4-benzoquinol methylase